MSVPGGKDGNAFHRQDNIKNQKDGLSSKRDSQRNYRAGVGLDSFGNKKAASKEFALKRKRLMMS